jgi:hypothetical protein
MNPWKANDEISDIASYVSRTYILNERDVVALAIELLARTGYGLKAVESLHADLAEAGKRVRDNESAP